MTHTPSTTECLSKMIHQCLRANVRAGGDAKKMLQDMEGIVIDSLLAYHSMFSTGSRSTDIEQLLMEVPDYGYSPKRDSFHTDGF